MKKRNWLVVLAMVLLLTMGCFYVEVQAAKKPMVKLNAYQVSLIKGQTYQLKVSVSGTADKVKYSSKTSVASVSKTGKIKAKKPGTTIIRVKVGKVTKTCKVKVTALRAPSLSAWKKTHDSSTCNCEIPHDGVEYTVTWKKVKGATGYQVYFYQNDMDGGIYKETENTTKLKYSIGFSYGPKKLNVKVRAYKKVDGQTIYGPWSKVKSKSISYKGGSSSSSTSSKVSYKNNRGKAYTYKNTKFSYGIGFGKTNSKVYIGVWNAAGTSASYEDFKFTVRDGQNQYTVNGLRSGYSYTITFTPHKNSVKLNIRCNNSAYSYFNINQTFQYSKNAYFLKYAN